MASIDFNKLYKLQDKVLKVIFSTENELYLTGGTCLHRFYLKKRYSDDLDFFTHQSKRFNFAVRKIKIALGNVFDVNVSVESKNFIRFIVNNILQIDFVNDVSIHCGDVVVNEKGFIIDNIENILSNKLTSVISRDEPKDVFDIFAIYKYAKIDWEKALECAHKKAAFGNEELLVKLRTFPKELLSKLNIIDKKSIEEINENYSDFILGIEKLIL